MTLADAGYFAGKHVAELHHRGQQVVMPDKARPTDHPYHKDQFIYDEETDSYTCPHRQTLAFTGIKSARKKSRIYRVASGAICRGCPRFRNLYEEWEVRAQRGDRTTRRRAATAQGVDGDR